MLMVKPTVRMCPVLSFPVAWKKKLPRAVGVPVMVPSALSVSPGGICLKLMRAHVTPTAPDIVSDPLYGVPTLPIGRFVVGNGSVVTTILN